MTVTDPEPATTAAEPPLSRAATARWMLGCLAVAVLVAGLWLGFSLESTTPYSGSVSCGSAFAPTTAADRASYQDRLGSTLVGGDAVYGDTIDYRGLCDHALSAKRTPSVLLTGLGTVTLIGLGFVVVSRRETE